jgi:hypothetical protein
MGELQDQQIKIKIKIPERKHDVFNKEILITFSFLLSGEFLEFRAAVTSFSFLNTQKKKKK